MIFRSAVFLVLFLNAGLLSAQEGLLGDQGMGSSGTIQDTLENCFRFPDPGMRSGCLMGIAAKEKNVNVCDLIEIPGMVHDCIDGVAAIAPVTLDNCKIMNEQYRDHCLRAAHANPAA